MLMRVWGATKRNLGIATLVSTFIASLLLNVELGIRYKLPERHVAGVKVGTEIKTLPIVGAGGGTEKIRLDGGKPTILYVMAPDCQWCARNLENIRALGKGASASYRFIGVSNTTKGLSDYIAATPLPFSVHAVQMDNLPKGFDASLTPQMVLVQPDGKVQRVWPGALSGGRKDDVERFFHVKLPGA